MVKLPSSQGRTGPVMGPDQPAEGPVHAATALIGVYRSEADAQSVARSLREAGTPDHRIRLGNDDDAHTSLLAEMQQETSESMMMPIAGIAHTKEATKGALLMGPPLVILCGLLALPLGFIPVAGAPLWLRLLIAALVGMAAGGTIAAIAGPAMGAKRPNEANAAQRGVVLRVDDPDARAEELMAAMDPIRLDRVAQDEPMPLETVITEEQFTPGGVAQEIERNAEDPLREDLPGRPHEGLKEHADGSGAKR
jgi:hypothetical protein